MQSWNFYLTTQIPFEIGKNTEPCSCRTPVSTLSKQPIKTLLVQFPITVVSSRSSFSGLFIRLSHIEISNSLLKSVYKTSTSSLSVKPINLTQNTIELACYDLFYASYNFCCFWFLQVICSSILQEKTDWSIISWFTFPHLKCFPFSNPLILFRICQS